LSELEEYYRNLMADIRREADASGIFPVEAFFDRMTERVTEAGELEVAERTYYQSGESGQKLRIDGYSGDPRGSEGVLGLIICDFADSDTVQSFGKADVPPILNPLIRFLTKAKTEQFRDSLNEANPAFQVSDMIITTWPHVMKVKLIIISNRRYTGRDDTVKLARSGDVPITWSVWDLTRFERFDRSGQAREDIVIDFAGDFGEPLPALKASQTGAALESYLLVVPGEQLAAIYDKWGARLLEANVRSFLQARAKTNKGIQKTIKDEPELFFPYNNGLSATADAVHCIKTNEGLAVASISNLQIVNGAQTTGSIHAGLKSAKDQLPRVFVQMKLTVVPPEKAEEVIPKISEFANTQNKVNAADFFSNHPFHVRVEQDSRTVLFPAREGVRLETKWFYERSRGQYLNERARLGTSQQKKFDLEFPKSQLFSKTDLAKFEYSSMERPHIVSRGAQKNFADFASMIGAKWSQDESAYDKLWFRRLVAKAIIFKTLEAEVPKQTWYDGGYRANIVTYAMAKIFYDAAGQGKVLELDSIWRRQVVSENLLRAMLEASAAAHAVITNPKSGFRNCSEWAKQFDCWAILRERKINYELDFQKCRVSGVASRHAAEPNVPGGAVPQKGKEGDSLAEVKRRGGPFWEMLLAWGSAEQFFKPREEAVLKNCSAMPARAPSIHEAWMAMELLRKARAEGFEDKE
jgi:hypothetical protein